MKFASCEIPLFGRHVLVAIDCTESEALHQFTEYAREKADGFFPSMKAHNDAIGWCQGSGGDVYVWTKDSYAVLSHELVHAAFMLCRSVDIGIDEELIARLVEHMKLNLIDRLEEKDGD